MDYTPSYLETEFFELLAKNQTIQKKLVCSSFDGIIFFNTQQEGDYWINSSIFLQENQHTNWNKLLIKLKDIIQLNSINKVTNDPITFEQETNLELSNTKTIFLTCYGLLFKETNRLLVFVRFKKNQKTNVVSDTAFYSSKYEIALTASNLGGWEYDATTNELWCSKEYFTLLGRESFDMPAWDKYSIIDVWENWLHPDDLHKAKAYFSNYLQNTEGTYQQSFRMLHKNGSWIWIWSRGKAMLKNEDNINDKYIIGTHTNINDHKNSEQELELAKQLINKDKKLLQSIINSPNKIYILSIDKNFLCTAFSNSFQNAYKLFTGKYLSVGQFVFELIPKSLTQIIYPYLEDALKGNYNKFEYKHFTSDKKHIDVEINLNPIKNQLNEIEGITVFAIDITESNEQALGNKLNQQKYESLFTSSTDAIFVADIETGIIVDVNEQACNLMGYSKEELIGIHQTALHPSDEFESIVEKFKLVTQEDNYLSVECNIQQKNGKKLPVEITTGKRFTVGDRVYAAAYFRDLRKVKDAAKKIADTEYLLNKAEEIAQTGSIEINLETNETIWSNEFFRILCLEPNKSVASLDNLINQIHQNDKNKFLSWMNNLSTSLNNSDKFIEIKIVNFCKVERTLLIHGSTELNEHGSIARLFMILKDITDKNILEEKLLYSHKQLKKLTDQIPFAILQLQSNDGHSINIQFASKGIRLIYPDLEEKNILNNPNLIFEHIHDEDKELIRTAFKNSLENITDIDTEFRYVKNDNSLSWLKVFFQVEKNDSNEIIWYGYIQDISIQKQILISLESQNKQLREVAWMQSHIVRAPLARLLGLVSLIQTNPYEEKELIEILNYIQLSANELDEIIKGIVNKTSNI